MKKAIIACLCLIMTFLMIGCDNPEAKAGEATAYGTTSGACPVSISVKVDGDGKVLEAEISEYLSVYDIGKLSNDNGRWNKLGTEIAEVEGEYARYVRIGDKFFVYDGTEYTCSELVEIDKSFDTYMENSEGARWYIKQMDEGNFDIVTENGDDYGVSFNEYDRYKLDKKQWANKMKNGYHEGVEYDKGWKEDIYKLITHLKNHGFYGYTGKEKPQGAERTFKIGRYDSLVSLENFHDYMRIAKKAYDAAFEQTISK